MFEAGTAKKEITHFMKGVGMMGYGMPFHTVRAQETELFVRAYVVVDTLTGAKIAFVNVEICFITIAIKRGVMKRLERNHEELGFIESNVMLSAQHTHSAPGGYSQYGLYNMSIPGFVPEVYQTIVDGITDAIVDAHSRLKPANLRFASGDFAPEEEVGFNRSIKAYNSNPEVEPIEEKNRHLAMERTMDLIRIDDMDGNPIGCINWFGTHTTSVPNSVNAICFDNKGYASEFFENQMKAKYPEFNAAFAQAISGDISPNYIYQWWKREYRGRYKNPYESAKYNGKLQFNKAKEIFEKAEKSPAMEGGIDHELMNVRLADTKAYPQFANNNEDAVTGPSCHGIAFFAGTTDGQGMAPPVVWISRFLIFFLKIFELYIKPLFASADEIKRIRHKYKVQGVKEILIETGDRRILCTPDVKNLFLPSWVDPSIAAFKEYHRRGSLDVKPWTPQVVPLHIIILGSIAIASIPGEITTVAGRRLKKTIGDVLAERGVEKVIICSYTNAYCGYISTYEEYQQQLYEGGHTVFGEHTFSAFQSRYYDLANDMLKPPNERQYDRSVEPVRFTDEEVGMRTYVEKKKKIRK